MNVQIIPLDHVEIDGAVIPFGMKRESVETLIGPGEQIGARNYYYNGEMAIDYDSDDSVEFFEFLGDVDSLLRPVIYDLSVFDCAAETLADVLKEKNGGEMIDREKGYSCVFPGLSIGLYRDFTPESIKEMMKEMEANGVPTDDNEGLEADKKRAESWMSIGVGVPGYYRTLI